MNTTIKKISSLIFLVIFFITPTIVLSAGVYDLGSMTELTDTGLSKRSIYNIIFVSMNWLLTLITFFTVIGFIVSGIYFITAGGKSGRAETAKAWLTYSIIGIIVALIGYIMVNLVDNLLKGDATNISTY